MAVALSRAIFCELPSKKSAIPRPRPTDPAADAGGGGGKIVLQPRLCTLRSYGSGSRDGVVRRTRGRGEEEGDGASTFFASLADYLDTARRSSDFEIVSGRLAMIVFAATVGVEAATGDSLFKKLDLQQIAEAAGVCAAVVALAAAFAWFSRARSRIGSMLTLSSFVDSLIDDIIDGLFYDIDLRDWTDKM
ncbi:putative stress enhanced protein 2, chloroplastic [Iris pallida]|uniref:Stress enhanced protein 2, chloroplastic n=1 Tax=Iris pallida TaxID=29817 RepID=A0AAX6ECY1_IRIPA|nr:putative stress enhanced protein 2, chloroplastic [Iris pallida]